MRGCIKEEMQNQKLRRGRHKEVISRINHPIGFIWSSRWRNKGNMLGLKIGKGKSSKMLNKAITGVKNVKTARKSKMKLSLNSRQQW